MSLMTNVEPKRRRLVPGAPLTVGVLAGWQFYRTTTPFNYLSLIFRGIRTAARDHGVNLLLACGMGTSADPAIPPRPAWPVPSPVVDFVPVGHWNTDGLIVATPLLAHARSEYIQGIMAAGHPVVFVASGEQGPTIAADNAGGIFQALQHLIAHGHRQIAFLAGDPGDLLGDAGDRLRAYRLAVQQFGLADDSRLVAYGLHSFEGGLAAVKQILASGAPFSAIVASNDESALGAMQGLREARREIPQQVAIIGFDDRPEAAAQTPTLTSIHVPLFTVGYRSLELVLQRIDHPGEAPAPYLRIPTRLVVRESCGCQESEIAELAAAPTGSSARAIEALPAAGWEGWLARVQAAMAEAVLAETQRLSADEVHAGCHELLEAFTASLRQGHSLPFQQAIEDLVMQARAAGDDAHLWQSPLTVLRTAYVESDPGSPVLIQTMLDRARVAISEAVRRQYRAYALTQRSTADRLGLLTAQLLQALDEAQILEALAQHLPALGLRRAAVGFFEAAGEDAVAWTLLQLIPGPPPRRISTRQFPGEGIFSDSEPLSLALLPLVSQRGRAGFMAFDSAQLDIYGAIVQQVSAAVNSVQLYREATEGRRLAEEADRLKSRFLSMVSHELRNPLNLIIGLSQITLQEKVAGRTPLPLPYRQDLERIHTSAQHLSWLIRDVLDLASSEAGRLRLANELLDLSETLQPVAETGRHLAQDKNLAWQEVLPEPGPWIWGDRVRLRQVGLNLVSNAVKFTVKGGICLRVEELAGSVRVSVSDTGIGLPPEEQALVFDEFGRSERASAGGYSGLGLGLAICKRLVELHGGQIGVQSSGEEGEGSTFYFTLPTVDPARLAVDDEALARLTGRTVLLLTRHTADAERVRAYLDRRGVAVEVICLDLMPDWAAYLAQHPPQAVAIDIGLAPAQGWDVLNVLKGNPATQHIPVLFYTLTQGRGSVMEIECLTKPVGITQMAEALAQQGFAAEESSPEKTILIVDDDPAPLEMHARLAQTQMPACQVLKARNGREALAHLERQPPDLVLLDLMMPELDGFGVLEAMRAGDHTRDIPVIVVTGQALTEKDMARLSRGVATVLDKGMFSVDETLAHIEAALTRKRKLGSEAQRLVRQAMAFLHEHYSEPLSRQDLAQHVGMSDDYLTHCFRQELGMTPVAYLNRYRVAQARPLLKETDQSITEIALAVGFSNSGYFSRVFRRETGLSPEAFRRA